MNGAPAGAAPRPDTDGAGGGAVPRHVAIIMDGNGRWAKARGLPKVAGHKQGAEAARKVLRAAGECGIECLTLYAFSSENWRRPKDEVSDLMGLLSLYISRELDALHREGVRIKIIGDHGAFQPEVARLIDKAVAKTASNQRMTLAVALNYGGQREITKAVQALARKVEAGVMSPDAISEAEIETELDTRDLPPLDLLIRTSGEYRLSNFLLWQAAYAELLFTDTLWPDFDGDAFRAALSAFGARERRFGGR